jgi:hypothetical protein
MKTRLLSLLLCAAPLAAQENNLPPTAIDALSAFKVTTGRDKVTGLVEVRGTAGTPTPEVWTIVVYDPRSTTKLEEFRVRGTRVEDRGPNKDYYPQREPSGYFDMGKVSVDCAGAFRIADKEAGRAMVGFDVIDYHLRCREFSEDPVWTLTLKTTAGVTTGTVALSAVSGKVLRTIWRRPAGEGRAFPEDSAVPPEFRPPLPAELPDPFPSKPPVDPAAPMPQDPGAPAVPAPAPAPDALPPIPEGELPPPPPLPPLGQLPPKPNITPD